uniref:Serine/threonine kinase n=1 Tax=Schistosoma mansoni TaxID=6183 RepID=A0A3Q0KFH0_SCHMA
MADYLKSALSYFSTSNTTKNENEFLGSSISVGQLSLKVRRVIAEGGYGIVYEAQDVNENISYALKRMLAHDKPSADLILHEVRLLKQLNGHPNILKFFSAASVGKEKMKVIGTEFLIVTEFCKGGQLDKYLPASKCENPLPSNIILQIFHQCCRGVQHMHSQCPPVIHRDLKIENLLLTDNFIIKLCDFGSATTITYSPDQSWTALKRGSVQEELERFTTPMYRAPEMLDLYQNYPIGTPSDIWALGCILFYLTCTYHPFEDSSKLAILNANYSIPASISSENAPFCSLIRQLLLINPSQRPNINEILGELSELASMREVQVSGSIPLLEEVAKRRNVNVSATFTSQPINRNDSKANEYHPGSMHSENNVVANPQLSSNKPSRPNPITMLSQQKLNPTVSFNPPTSSSSSSSSTVVITTQSSTVNQISSNQQLSNQSMSNMLGMIKGGAGNLIRNIRDASTKVIGTVSTTLNTELDFQFITSRIAVTSFPIESGFEVLANVNSIEEMQNMLDTRFQDAYAVYNLSNRPYRSDHWFHGRVSHRGFEAHRAPTLKSLIELCLNARLWLAQKSNNICVIHCTDGKTLSAVLACSLLCFCRVFDNASPAIQLFASKRGNPGLNASQIRYINYVAQLSHNRAFTPHHFPLNLISLIIAPVPTFNKSKNGCRPYVEIFEGKTKVYSTYADYDNLRSYVLEDGKIQILLNGLTVLGDLTVIIYHCRSAFAGRGKISSVKIAQFQLHTGFVEHNLTELIYFKSDLDHLDNSSSFAGFTSRYAESFHVTLEFMVSPTERPRQSDNLVYPWETLPSNDLLSPKLCVSNHDELKDILSDYGRFNRKSSTRMYERKSSEPNQSNDPSEKDCITTNINSDESCNSTNQSTTNLFTTTHAISGSTTNLKQNTEINDILVSDLINDDDMPRNHSHNYAYSLTSSDHSKQTNYNLLNDKFGGDFFSSSKSQANNNMEASSDDLLGFHVESSFPNTDTATTSPTTTSNTDDPILIDVAQNPFVIYNKNSLDEIITSSTTSQHNNSDDLKQTDQKSFVDDLFNFNSSVEVNSKTDIDWENVFGITSSESTKTTTIITTSHSTTTNNIGLSNNPFDPFGIATSELSDFFSVPNSNISSEKSTTTTTTILPNKTATTTPSPPTTITNTTTSKDYFGQQGSHLSASASASNFNPLFTSASFTNLSPNVETIPDKTTTTATTTTTTTNGIKNHDRLDPFADFADVLRDRLNSQNCSSTNATNGDNTYTPPSSNRSSTNWGGFSAGPSPAHHFKSSVDSKFMNDSSNHKESSDNLFHGYEKSSQSHSSYSNFPNTTTTTGSTSIPNSGGTGARPHVNKDAFSDLLGGFGSSRTNNTDDNKQPKTVNQIRREKMAKTIDPEQLKVFDWAEGKDRNLRALLCSLPAILWDGAQWNHVGMADLITRDQVKRQYRKAARVVHPDKWMSTSHENIARLVFVELNDAMAEFDKNVNNNF